MPSCALLALLPSLSTCTPRSHPPRLSLTTWFPVCVVQVKRSETIEIGRVVSINYGPLAGKVATIIDIVDQARALIDGPESVTGVRRQTIPVRNLSLTSIVVPIARGVRPGTLKAKLAKAQALEQWKASNWARKVARHTQRTQLSDFQRFQLMLLKKERAKTVGVEFAQTEERLPQEQGGGEEEVSDTAMSRSSPILSSSFPPLPHCGRTALVLRALGVPKC